MNTLQDHIISFLLGALLLFILSIPFILAKRRSKAYLFVRIAFLLFAIIATFSWIILLPACLIAGFLFEYYNLSFIFVTFLSCGIGLIILRDGDFQPTLIRNSYQKIFSKPNIIAWGKKYTGKIYGYAHPTDDRQIGTMLRVRYFDEYGQELERSFYSEKMYPLGMTITIYRLRNYYAFDELSIILSKIDRENELMDDRLMNDDSVEIVLTQCPHCGASFEAVKLHSNQCPFCDGYVNVE